MSKLTKKTEEFIDLCKIRNIERDNSLGMFLTILNYDRERLDKNLQSFIEWINAHPEADDCAMIDYIQENYIK